MKHSEVQARRNKITKVMGKSVIRPEDIAKTTGIELKHVYSDLRYLKKDAQKWLYGYVNEGYVFVTKQTVDSLYDIELELQEMRQNATTPENKLKIMKELRETINTRWVIQGEGPTLMGLKKREVLANPNVS